MFMGLYIWVYTWFLMSPGGKDKTAQFMSIFLFIRDPGDEIWIDMALSVDEYLYLVVSINGASRKCMVYNGKAHVNRWFRGTPISGNSHFEKTHLHKTTHSCGYIFVLRYTMTCWGDVLSRGYDIWFSRIQVAIVTGSFIPLLVGGGFPSHGGTPSYHPV